MTDIEHLINMNVEIEGLLRVLERRDNASARSLLSEKVKAYNTLLQSYLESPSAANEEAAENAAKSILADADAIEVKDQEAESEEVMPEEDAAEEAIAHETETAPKIIEDDAEAENVPKASATVNVNLAKAFTLNDRFRFKRELFGGDDADFTDTLQLLSEMDSYAEAEDYLLKDMMWDKEDPAVADFLAILAQNMPDGKR